MVLSTGQRKRHHAGSSSQLFISLNSTNVFLRDRSAVANKQPYESHAENVNHMKLEDDGGDEERKRWDCAE